MREGVGAELDQRLVQGLRAGGVGVSQALVRVEGVRRRPAGQAGDQVPAVPLAGRGGRRGPGRRGAAGSQAAGGERGRGGEAAQDLAAAGGLVHGDDSSREKGVLRPGR